MRNTQPAYLFPKLNDSVLNDTPTNDNDEELSFDDNYAKWRNLTLVAKTIHRFKTPLVERIRSEVFHKFTTHSYNKGKSSEECDKFVVSSREKSKQRSYVCNGKLFVTRFYLAIATTYAK